MHLSGIHKEKSVLDFQRWPGEDHVKKNWRHAVWPGVSWNELRKTESDVELLDGEALYLCSTMNPREIVK